MNNWYCDVGFGFGKFLGNNQQIILPSIVGSKIESDFDQFSSDSKSIDVDGLGSFTFSNNAHLSEHRRDYEWIFSPEYRAELLLGISRTLSPNTREIECRIMTGLPGRDYERGKEYRRRFQSTLKGEYRISRNDNRQRIIISKVGVTSQMYGPIFYHLVNDAGRFSKPDTNADSILIGSVNVGSNTVEIGTVEITNLNSKVPNLDALGQNASEPRGVFSLLPILKQRLEECFQGERFEDYEALEILKRGDVRLYNQIYPVDLDKIKKTYSQNILKLCTNVWGDRISRLFALILTGGGAHIIADYFKSYHQNIVVSDDSQWDCVRGYQRLDALLKGR